MSILYVQSNTLYLAGSGVTVGATSIVLTSLTDIYGNVLSMASFGTKGYITLEPDTTNEEGATFTGITANSNGTYTLTGVSTILAVSPYTETSGLVRAHSGGTKVVITDNVAFWATFPNKNTAEVITQNWQVPDPVGSLDIANKEYVLSVVNGGPVSFDQEIVSGTAGENLTKAQAVYLKNDGKWYRTSSGAAGTCLNVQLGIVQATVSSGAACTVCVSGVDKTQTSLSVGSTYYLNDTLGTIGTSAGTISVDIGTAISATNLQFNPFATTSKVLSSVANARTSSTGANNNVPIAPSSGAPNIDITWLDATTGTTDQSQTTQNSSIVFGQQNLTTKHYLVAQSFVPARQSISAVTLSKVADTGSFTGTVKIALQADSAGSPSGSDLASYTITNAVWTKLNATANFTVSFTSEYETLTVGSTYWIVVTPSTTDDSNHPNLGINTAGGYASGLLKYNNTADGWVTVSTSKATFVTIDGILNKLPVTSSTSGQLPLSVSPYSFVAMTITPATVTSTTTPTTVYSKQLSGGFFTANSGIRVRAFFTFDGSASAGTLSATDLKFNGTSFGTVHGFTANNTGWAKFSYEIEYIIIGNNSTSSQTVLGYSTGIPFGAGGGSVTAASLATQMGAGASLYDAFTTSTVNLANPGLLEIVVTNSSSAAIPTVFSGAIIEKIG